MSTNANRIAHARERETVEVRLIPNEGLKHKLNIGGCADRLVEVRLIPNEGLKQITRAVIGFIPELKYDSSRTRD